MNQLIEKNIKYILNKKVYRINSKYLNILTKTLNSNKFIILSGIKNIGKSELLSDFIKKTNSNNNVFYFNKDLDSNNLIKKSDDLKSFFNKYIKDNTISIIILENISKIENIKEFISFAYKLKCKLIITGNNIKVPSIPEVELKNNIGNNLINNLNYGNIGKTSYFSDIEFKQNYINLLKNDILTKEVFNIKGVKNIVLYNYTITFISLIFSYNSIRDLHKQITVSESISLKTFIDYLDFSIQSKIIKKVPRFDIKNNKVISSKNKYYFTDNGIRNSFTDFSLSNEILKDNLLFIKLYSNDFIIYGGLNGLFEFSFIAKKEDKKIFIHISKQTEKNEIKKEVNKLLKIPGKNKCYLIVNNLEKLNIKKRIYDSLEILSFEEAIKKDL